MTMSPATRREILRRATALSCVGAAASTFGFQLATMGNAAAQTAPHLQGAGLHLHVRRQRRQQHGAGDRQRQLGPLLVRASTRRQSDRADAGRHGADASGRLNAVTGRVLPNNNTAYAFPESWGGVLPITSAIPNPVPPGTNALARTFALNPHLAPLVPIWQAGRLAVAANVGPLIVPTTKTQYRNRSVPLPRQPDVAQRPAVDLAGRLHRRRAARLGRPDGRPVSCHQRPQQRVHRHLDGGQRRCCSPART